MQLAIQPVIKTRTRSDNQEEKCEQLSCSLGYFCPSSLFLILPFPFPLISSFLPSFLPSIFPSFLPSSLPPLFPSSFSPSFFPFFLPPSLPSSLSFSFFLLLPFPPLFLLILKNYKEEWHLTKRSGSG